MRRYIIGRLLAVIPLLFAVSLLVFSLTYLIPGDPAVSLAGEDATPARISDIRELLGLNDPYFVRYGHWLSDVFHGDLGTSFVDHSSVTGQIKDRLPASFSLGFLTLVYATVVGVTLGVIAGRRAGRAADRLVTFLASLGLAMPHFWLGMLLILSVALRFDVLPAVGYSPLGDGLWGWFSHLILPAIALGSAVAAEIARQTRASVSSVMQLEYVRTAESVGLSPRRIGIQYVLRNALIPVVTVIGLQAARILSASVVIEQLFAVPGLGSLAYRAVFERDFPVIQGVVLVASTAVVLVNLLVDVVYGILDPRIRLGDSS